MKTLLLSAIISAVLAAQTSPQEAQRRKDLCKVSGQLANAVTNEPIRKAKVTLHPDDPGKTVYTVNSDGEGKFLLENIDPGRYTLSGERQGFVTESYGAARAMAPGSTIDLKAGKEVSEIHFKLTPQGVIAGRVLDDEGEPVSGLTVMALHYAYVSGHKRLMPAVAGGLIQTNDLGEYRVPNLPPDRYYLESTPQKMTSFQTGTEKPTGSGPEEGFIPVYYPNSPDPGSASPVDVAPGAEVRGINLRLRKAHVMRVSGKLMNSVTGEPVKNGMIMLYRRESAGMAMLPSSMYVVQGGKGEFELRDVAPGSYTILSMVTSDPQNMMLATSSLEVADQSIKDVALSVGGGSDIPVTVRFADGVTVPVNPAAAASDKTDPKWDLSNIHVMLQVEDNPMMSLAMAQIGKDHKGLLKHVNPDKFKIMLMGIPPNLYLQSARLGSQDVLESGLDARQATSGSLDLVIGSPAAELTGSVKNDKGEAVSSAIVTMIPKDPKARTDMTRTGTTDQNGQFRISGAVPAEYWVYAWEDVDPGAPEDEEFRKPFEKLRADADLTKSVSAAPVQLIIISKAMMAEEKARGK